MDTLARKSNVTSYKALQGLNNERGMGMKKRHTKRLIGLSLILSVLMLQDISSNLFARGGGGRGGGGHSGGGRSGGRSGGGRSFGGHSGGGRSFSGSRTGGGRSSFSRSGSHGSRSSHSSRSLSGRRTGSHTGSRTHARTHTRSSSARSSHVSRSGKSKHYADRSGHRHGRRHGHYGRRWSHGHYFHRHRFGDPFYWSIGLVGLGFGWFNPYFGFWYPGYGYYWGGGLGYYYPFWAPGYRYGYWVYPFDDFTYTIYTASHAGINLIIENTNAQPLYFAFYYADENGNYERDLVARKLTNKEIAKAVLPEQREGSERVLVIARSERALRDSLSEKDVSRLISRNLENQDTRAISLKISGQELAEMSDADVARINKLEEYVKEDRQTIQKHRGEMENFAKENNAEIKEEQMPNHE